MTYNDIPDADDTTTAQCGTRGAFGGFPVICERPVHPQDQPHATILGPLSPTDRTPHGTPSFWRAEVPQAKAPARKAVARHPFWVMYGDNGTEYRR